eukprot:848564-Prymnesium_polylepis.1
MQPRPLRLGARCGPRRPRHRSRRAIRARRGRGGDPGGDTHAGGRGAGGRTTRRDAGGACRGRDAPGTSSGELNPDRARWSPMVHENRPLAGGGGAQTERVNACPTASSSTRPRQSFCT